MKISFGEKGFDYVEVQQAEDGIFIVLSARGENNPQEAVVNSVKLTKEQFLELISDLDLPKN